VRIIDALEFDAALRLLEPAEELAVLAVDAERIAGGWVGDALRQAYESLAEDPVPTAVWRFQLALRAATRAKVALWHLDDPAVREVAERERWLRRGHEYLELAARQLAR
jgi:aminoglycoside phosphotransferase family enzyme